MKIGGWTDGQIACYIGEKIKQKEVIVLENGPQIEGIIFFKLKNKTTIHIEQFWSLNKETVRRYLKILRDNFPTVTTLTGFNQRTRKDRIYNVDKFIRIYG